MHRPRWSPQVKAGFSAAAEVLLSDTYADEIQQKARSAASDAKSAVSDAADRAGDTAAGVKEDVKGAGQCTGTASRSDTEQTCCMPSSQPCHP